MKNDLILPKIRWVLLLHCLLNAYRIFPLSKLVLTMKFQHKCSFFVMNQVQINSSLHFKSLKQTNKIRMTVGLLSWTKSPPPHPSLQVATPTLNIMLKPFNSHACMYTQKRFYNRETNCAAFCVIKQCLSNPLFPLCNSHKLPLS